MRNIVIANRYYYIFMFANVGNRNSVFMMKWNKK